MLATATVFQNPRLPVGNLMFLALLDLPVHPYDNMVSDFAPRIVIVGGVAGGMSAAARVLHGHPLHTRKKLAEM